MKKKIFLIALNILPILIFGQSQFDVRKAHWGMTIENVISSEYPLQPIKGNGKLEYSKVDIGNGFLAKIKTLFIIMALINCLIWFKTFMLVKILHG